MPFVKGQSGNPSGKTRTKPGRKPREVLQLWRDKSPAAHERIRQLVDAIDDRVALDAAKFIIERAEGKVADRIELDTPEGGGHFGELVRSVIRERAGRGAK
jgi:hypothetical protein